MVCVSNTPASSGQTERLFRELGSKIEALEEKIGKSTNTVNAKCFSLKFGESISAASLMACVERQATTFNVYWKLLEAAAGYNVEVYKAINNVWYKLAEISAGRAQGYAAITDLVGDGYVFRVVAEGRGGEMLARSAGLVIGFTEIK